MRISSKGDYGLRALFDLAQRYGEGPIQSDEIASRQGIPVNYLNQLLITLRRAGLIDSLRGPQGGHLLARKPEQISLLDILTVLEGPLLPIDHGRDDRMPSVPEDHRLIDDLWGEMRETIAQQLAAVSLDDLCQRKRHRSGEVMYYI
ncbi:MAG: Rrf2 family transcriptional regulator [Oscillochloris sp.]|nr:Rrf2 family transcriptional regulator [Oscillochloris sp.]